MDKLTQLRMCENMEEDAYSDIDMMEEYQKNTKKDYREKYKEFYSDIKLDVKEDW